MNGFLHVNMLHTCSIEKTTHRIFAGMYTILTLLHNAYKNNDNERNNAIYNQSVSLMLQ